MPMTLRMSDTWRTVLETPRMAGSHSAILVHLYPPGPGMGVCHPLTDREVVIGRGDDCDLTIAEQSVSRRHARIEFGAQGYVVADLQSTNGTFVNDQPVTQCALRDGDYLRVGSCIYRFLSGSNIEAEYHEEIYRLIIFDALTDVPNKRHLSEFLDRELARTLRHRRPLSVALLDIDRFKALNDQRGHLAGDYTLRELAACVVLPQPE